MEKKRCFLKVALLFSVGLFFTSCVDDAYDLSKDVDLTMQLGSNGLTLKLGNTEKMYLRDVLEVEDSDMLDTLSTGLFYLSKTGTTDVDVHIGTVDPIQISPIDILTDYVLQASSSGVTLPGNTTYNEVVEGTKTVDLDITRIDDAIKELHTVIFSGAVMTVRYAVDNTKFSLVSGSDVKLTCPSYIKSSKLNSKNEYSVPNGVSSFSIPIDSIVLPVNGSYGQKVVDGEINLSSLAKIAGTFKISTNGTVSLAGNEGVRVKASVTFSTIQVNAISGLVDPTVDVATDDIVIGDDLPDFLTDSDVELQVANPTLRFDVDGTDLPVPLLFSGALKSIKSDAVQQTVEFPSEGYVSLANNKETLCYFSQSAQPFDPEGVSPTAIKEQVDNLGSLVTRIPDKIEVLFENGRIKTDPSVEHHLSLSRNYRVSAAYRMLVPFVFNEGLSIVYSDSTDNMNDDMKHYQADGITITTKIKNTIPLDLQVEIIPLDVNGDVIDEITVGTVTAAAGSTATPDTPTVTDATMTLTPQNRSDISRIDRFKFRIKGSAAALASGEELISDQYVELNELRIKLNGQIVGDFN